MADQSMEEMLARIQRLELENAQLESETRRTTFVELLEQCHIQFSDRLNVESNPALATGVQTSKVTHKLRPERMERWTGFPNDRKAAFSEAQDLFQTHSEADQRRFSSTNAIDDRARLARHKVSCEIDTRLYHYSAVEPFVQEVLNHLISVTSLGEEPGETSTIRANLGLGNAVSFENHANSLTKSQESDAKLARPMYADQVCVRHRAGGDTTAVAVVELKPPHKATRELITAGLRPMNLEESVIKPLEDPAPSSSKGKFQRAADKFVAMIVTQTFSYMAESGISHGCIITGEIMIFLRILNEDPRTVYFYHADPIAEVADERKLSQIFPHHCTSIAQLVSFCLMAHRTPIFDQKWRATAREGPRWPFSKREAIDQIPMDAVHLERPESAFTPRREITRSFQGPSIGTPIPLLFKSKCSPEFVSPSRKPDSNDDPDGEYEDESPTKERHERQSKGKQPQGNPGQGTGATKSSRRTTKDYAYCTQQCLKGLIDRDVMDSACSNYDFHLQKDGKHAITRQTFARLLRQQLAEDRDDYCLDLRHQGATGRLFKLTLASHGYTLVGKGTTSDFIVDSKREGRVYRHLKARQGKTIPVYLGNIDLVLPWIGGDMDIVHMLLLSFAGQSVLQNPGLRKHSDVIEDAASFNEECVQVGALHRDTVSRNIMWNEETQNLMFIDFDRTILFDLCRPPRVVINSVEYFNVFGSWQHRRKQVHAKHLYTLQKPLTTMINSSNKGPGLPSPKAYKSDFVIWSEEAEEIGGMVAPSIKQASSKGREALVRQKQNRTIGREDDKENYPASSNGNDGTKKQGALEFEQMGREIIDETEIL
ncbi:MAG: hypothetical protein LQ341_006738 [Variospora aurantia]|nr:MAG: hypothetical protein LQ341_006738 [Variospora aurantia]